MIYLKRFKLLDAYHEDIILQSETRRIYNNVYPLHIFPLKDLTDIELSSITIFYGGNGSGKTTLLNIISEKLNANRKEILDKGNYFSMYVDRCDYEMGIKKPTDIKYISSDDVFETLLNVRAINSRVNKNKEALADVYLNKKFSNKDTSIFDYEEVKEDYLAKSRTMSKFIRERLGNNNILEMSNGESALMFFERGIEEDSIYFLDEPENSLSAENQIKLKKFIEESVRFYNCQFIISTHSPFLLNLDEALIYDLDESPVKIKKWNELKNVRIYYDFFKSKVSDFE